MSVHYLILAAVVWRVVKLRHAPRRRGGGKAAPWLVALASDAVLFGGLAYREHRRKVRAGKPTAQRDRRKATWVRTSAPGGDATGASRPRPWRHAARHPGQDMEIPF